MQLTPHPVLERLDLVAPVVAEALRGWPGAAEVQVVEIDPDLADTAAFSEAYGVPPAGGANCVLVSGRRAGEERVAACLVRSDTRADVNSRVKRLLDVRKASFHPHERAVEESGMEHGGITPLGLPTGWPVYVDARVPEIDRAIIGSGIRGSKLWVPGRLFPSLPGAQVVEGLATAG